MRAQHVAGAVVVRPEREVADVCIVVVTKPERRADSAVDGDEWPKRGLGGCDGVAIVRDEVVPQHVCGRLFVKQDLGRKQDRVHTVGRWQDVAVTGP